MNRNRIRICGRNTITEPTPANSAVDDQRAQQAVGQRIADRSCQATSSPPRAHRPGLPTRRTPPGTSRTGSRRGSAGRRAGGAAGRRGGGSAAAPAFRGRSRPSRCRAARRWSVKRIVGRAFAGADRARREQQLAELGEQRRRARAGAPRRSRSPARRALATGASASSTSPSRSARSTMLSATTVGRPRSISCCAKRR